MNFTNPDRLWSRDEVFTRPSPVPHGPGVYGWYFREIPSGVPVSDCHRLADMTLLYVGISPKRPPADGSPGSKQTLFHRIRYHYRGNAAGSTLRLTLGCLLSTSLGIQLRRVGSGDRMTFGKGEAALSHWMQINAFVTWVESSEPWQLEEQYIRSLSLPLNLDMNATHPHCSKLRSIRSAAKTIARELPIAL